MTKKTLIERLGAARLNAQVLGAWIISLACVAFLSDRAWALESQKVEIKYFALNPADYVGKEVELVGQIRASGPADSWFLLEDSTGKVLVTTTRLSEPLFCTIGSYARIRGKLTFLGDEFGLYFALSRLMACDPNAASLQVFFGRILQNLVHLLEP